MSSSSSSSLVARLALVASLPLGIAACFVDSSDHSRSATASGGPVPVQQDDAGTPAPGDGTASAYPITAHVDTNQTMQVSPGQGVGVFAEYVAGGHWHVWWTCDTEVNPQAASCTFDVKITPSEGSVSNVTSQNFQTATDALTTSSPSEIEAMSTVSTSYAGLIFDAPAGKGITLSATVGGLYDGRFLFFVEGGQIDDGYKGTVTDPIVLVPSAP